MPINDIIQHILYVHFTPETCHGISLPSNVYRTHLIVSHSFIYKIQFKPLQRLFKALTFVDVQTMNSL